MSAFKDYLREMKELECVVENCLTETILILLQEGIDINVTDRTIKYNPNHSRGVDSRISLNPTYSKIDGIDVISIFQRSRDKISADANPLTHALKGNKGWKIDDKSIIELFKDFVKMSKKINSKYDTIISIKSSSSLNNNFLYRLNKIIKCTNSIEDMFSKIPASEIISDGGIKIGTPPDKVNELIEFIEKMVNKDNYFTYKDLPVSLRQYIDKSSTIDANDVLKYSNMINDKDVLILDDTISSGKSISDNVKVINEMFVPKSITAITLFSSI